MREEDIYIKELNTTYRNRLKPSAGYPGTLKEIAPEKAVHLLLENSNETLYADARDKRFGYRRFYVVPGRERSPEISIVNKINRLYGRRIVPISELRGEGRHISNEEAINLLKNRSETVYGDYGVSLSGERIFKTFFVQTEQRKAIPIGKTGPRSGMFVTEDQALNIINEKYSDRVIPRRKMRESTTKDPFDAYLHWTRSAIPGREALNRIIAGEKIYGVKRGGKWVQLYTTASMKASRITHMKVKKRKNLTMLERVMRMVR